MRTAWWLAALAAACAFAAEDVDDSRSELRGLIERYSLDRGNLNRAYPIERTAARHDRLKRHYTDWLTRLDGLRFDGLSLDGRIDYLLFRNHLQREFRQLALRAKSHSETEPLAPFAQSLDELDLKRRRMEPVDARQAAAMLAAAARQVGALQKSAEGGPAPKKNVANRAAATVNSLRETLKTWFDFYNGYDPVFTWWVGQPYQELDKALDEYAKFLREKLAGVKAGDKETIVGDPVGREALRSELASEMIPYTPEELIEIANHEFAWCEAEMKRAARDLGFGDDWKKALEHVKTLHVEPGKQPEVVRQLAVEALDFLGRHDLVTVPPIARETWRMAMMSPERQLVNPFFLGGETITVSYPTNTMTHEQKLMSLRGNNTHFSRATVQHELIPGHHLQGFMSARYRAHRRLFSTPFVVEGWALYWEMLLWDLGFPKTPEDRVGMLFWRMHRCARIIFSLNFHLEKMTPEECVDFLVRRVGHERDNAAGEVRRSFEADYAPLYQVAYMLGGLQFKALHKELVGSGKMTNRAFHDAVLRENSVPVEMIRAALTKQALRRDFVSGWKFYGRD